MLCIISIVYFANIVKHALQKKIDLCKWAAVTRISRLIAQLEIYIADEKYARERVTETSNGIGLLIR
jgi:hypothetical protein